MVVGWVRVPPGLLTLIPGQRYRSYVDMKKLKYNPQLAVVSEPFKTSGAPLPKAMPNQQILAFYQLEGSHNNVIPMLLHAIPSSNTWTDFGDFWFVGESIARVSESLGFKTFQWTLIPTCSYECQDEASGTGDLSV